MNIRTILGTAALAIAMLVPAGAQAQKAVVVISKDGTQHEVALSETTRIDIGAEGVKLHGADGAHEVAFADLDRILIGSEWSSVKEILTDSQIAVWPTRVSTMLYVGGLDEGATAAVYSLGGTLVAKAIASEASTPVAFDLSKAAPGVYIVETGSQSVKIVKQ